MIPESNTTALDLLLKKVYRERGHDFREYKRGTITRRLERRLHATGAKTYLDYMRLLDAHPEEYQRLTDYLTVAVSGFFRSPYTLEQVAKLVLTELVTNQKDQTQRKLRFWSAACARGEEPYSIAISISQFLGHTRRDFDILIYATDINQPALTQARAGIYSPKDVESLSPAILASYFTQVKEGYTVDSVIRQMVNFSYFDLVSTKPPPFMNLDCIFCCNLFIYLQKQLQEKVLGMLYQSLATPGYLVLGEVETPTDSFGGKLKCLDIKAKIYQKV